MKAQITPVTEFEVRLTVTREEMTILLESLKARTSMGNLQARDAAKAMHDVLANEYDANILSAELSPKRGVVAKKFTPVHAIRRDEDSEPLPADSAL